MTPNVSSFLVVTLWCASAMAESTVQSCVDESSGAKSLLQVSNARIQHTSAENYKNHTSLVLEGLGLEGSEYDCDTPGWTNEHDTHAYSRNCAYYAWRGYCKAGQWSPPTQQNNWHWTRTGVVMKQWAVGPSWNNPEDNCFVCGKGVHRIDANRKSESEEWDCSLGVGVEATTTEDMSSYDTSSVERCRNFLKNPPSTSSRREEVKVQRLSQFCSKTVQDFCSGKYKDLLDGHGARICTDEIPDGPGAREQVG